MADDALQKPRIVEAPKKPSTLLNFIIGGSAGMFATCCIQPIDYIKVQCQVQAIGKKGAKVNPFAVAVSEIKKVGFLRLYHGIDSALLRQATYTTIRMGVYKSLFDYGTHHHKGSSIPAWEKAVYALTAGGVGAMFGNPADLALIRMQSDHTLPPEQRRGYTSVVNALTRIIKEEGFFKMWAGSAPTVARAMSLNLGMLAPYDQAKESLKSYFGEFKGIAVASSGIAAFFACLFSLPFDNVKTKYQRMAMGADGKLPYSGFVDCFSKSLAQEGALGLYVGFWTYVIRIAPHAIITLLTVDYLQARFNKPS
jgi:solute carrier family 25 oxoglutarate transporter 11